MPGPRLSLSERAQIEVLFGQGYLFPQIAEIIGRDRTTVWREMKRNNSYRGAHLTRPGARHPQGRRNSGGRLGGLYRWVYDAHAAQHNYRVRARRPRRRKLCGYYTEPVPVLWTQYVLPKVKQRWSPQQISAWLAATYPDRPELQVSHETIYQAIYLQSRGQLRAEVTRQQALRSGRVQRRTQSRRAHAGRGNRAWLADFHISTRPAQVADRAVPGHWEGDLIIGAGGHSAIITLVERSSRYLMLGALPGSRVSEHVITVLTDLMRRVPAHLAKSLTWDQGIEMRQHAAFTLATDCHVYFCDPHAPWQRGSNENTNGLLRQYFPKGTSLASYTQHDLDQIAEELNTRPRKTLGWQTPAHTLNTHLVATGS